MKLAKDQIARQFSRAAQSYDLAAQLQHEMAAELIRSVPAALTGTLVDLGCGTGWALRKLAQTNRFELTAIDIAPGMIEVAKSHVPSARFHCCDLEETPLESNYADVVFSNAAIQWCNTDEAIGEMYRICKPLGSIVCSTFGPTTLAEVRSAWFATGDETARVNQFESKESLESVLKHVGFASAEIASVERKLTFDSVDSLLLAIKQMGATNASASRPTGLMGTKLFQEFRNVFERRISRDGQLELTFECIFVLANKE